MFFPFYSKASPVSHWEMGNERSRTTGVRVPEGPDIGSIKGQKLNMCRPVQNIVCT